MVDGGNHHRHAFLAGTGFRDQCSGRVDPLMGLREAAAGSVLIDLHFYPVMPWPVELDVDTERPEIVLGTNADLSLPAWRGALVDHFRAAGYTVGLNWPHGGVIDAAVIA